MVSYPAVEVINAPGYEDFEGELIMEVPSVTGELMSIVGDENKALHIIPAHYVYTVGPEMDCS